MRNPIQPIATFATPEDTATLMEYCTLFNGSERTIAITCAAMALNLAHKMVQDEINKGDQQRREQMKANDMSEDELLIAARNMERLGERLGGSFAEAIALAFFRAERTNKVRLVDAFADLFERYAHE